MSIAPVSSTPYLFSAETEIVWDASLKTFVSMIKRETPFCASVSIRIPSVVGKTRRPPIDLGRGNVSTGLVTCTTFAA